MLLGGPARRRGTPVRSSYGSAVIRAHEEQERAADEDGVARADRHVLDHRTLPAEKRLHERRKRLPAVADRLGTISCRTIPAPKVVTSHAMFVAGSKRPSGITATRSTASPISADSTITSRSTTTRSWHAFVEGAREQPPGEVAADDDERALGEVHDASRGEDQAVSERDQRVDRADRHGVDDAWSSLADRASPLSVDLALVDHCDAVARRVGGRFVHLRAPSSSEDLACTRAATGGSPPASVGRGGRDRCSRV